MSAGGGALGTRPMFGWPSFRIFSEALRKCH